MDSVEQKKIKDYLNSPNNELLEIIYDQFDTPNADLAKWTLNYRLYENMSRLNQAIQESTKNTAKYNRYMFWLAIFMASATFLNMILIILGVWININF
ncbi:hypothetical protein K8R42_00150 [bacterium]|nr:hypothetical protein [bacterium]